MNTNGTASKKEPTPPPETTREREREKEKEIPVAVPVQIITPAPPERVEKEKEKVEKDKSGGKLALSGNNPVTFVLCWLKSTISRYLIIFATKASLNIPLCKLPG